MMTLDEVTAVLDRVTYRPGWSLRVREGRVEGNPDLTGGLHLVVQTMVPDAFGPGDVLLDVQVPLPPVVDEAALLAFVQWRLLRIETHESREWLKVDGKVYDSPHAPHADRDL